MARFHLARLTLNGEMVLQTQPPAVSMGKATIELPTGSFLQATEAAQDFLADYVAEALKGAKNVADLFCGVGPFALRLAQSSKVFAADSDKPAIEALDQARRLTRGLKQLTAKRRDLFREEMTRYELADYDAVVLDPPRAGALNQVRELAASKVKTIAMIACDPKTFARDAATLIAGGYRMKDLMVVDQFVHSTHIEIAATFSH
ncbi:methyltransferase [Devosia rhodophyticola]|uniref:Methyltransferase n=1 Tax=Devosia rhodophyticola TaxID=3026423 RepID=A0ABY7Z164_9HYPH|nr:methyltransferase [Devosia rhodophyticola]WDR07403.1 methyltransferase [Devosia rhodophyticola]